MKDFYPVIVQSTASGNSEGGRAEVKEDSGDSLIEVLYIDHKGIVTDKLLLQAILNGNIVKTNVSSSSNLYIKIID